MLAMVKLPGCQKSHLSNKWGSTEFTVGEWEDAKNVSSQLCSLGQMVGAVFTRTSELLPPLSYPTQETETQRIRYGTRMTEKNN